MGWRMREPYCPLSSAVCNATIPTLPLFEIYGRICIIAVLLRFTLSFVYKVYIGFLSCIWLDSSIAVSTVNLLVQYICKYGCTTTSLIAFRKAEKKWSSRIPWGRRAVFQLRSIHKIDRLKETTRSLHVRTRKTKHAQLFSLIFIKIW
jgi:hypothetical protein